MTEARELSKQRVAILRHLYERDSRYGVELSDSLSAYAVCLRSAGLVDQACAVGADDTALMRFLYEHNPEKHRHHFSTSLRNYGVCLRDATRFDETCEVAAEDLSLCHHLLRYNSNQHWYQFSLSLLEFQISRWAACLFDKALVKAATGNPLQVLHCNPFLQVSVADQLHQIYSLIVHGKSLIGATRYAEACRATSEAVTLSHRLYRLDPETHRSFCSASLHHYALSLEEAMRHDEACRAGKEAVALSRGLFDEDPERYRAQLSISLREHGVSLRNLERLEEACTIGAEALALIRYSVGRKLERHQRRPSPSQHQCLYEGLVGLTRRVQVVLMLFLSFTTSLTWILLSIRTLSHIPCITMGHLFERLGDSMRHVQWEPKMLLLHVTSLNTIPSGIGAHTLSHCNTME